MKKIALCALATLLAASGLTAAGVAVVNLGGLIAHSDRIFHGRCLSAQEMIEPATGLPITRYRFEVVDGLQGVRKGDVVTFRQLLGVTDLPQYRPGEELLLFLAPDSRIGLTSPVGMGQGCFRLQKRQQMLGWVNGVDNRYLGYRLDFETFAGGDLSADQKQVLQEGRPLGNEVLRDILRKLQRNRQQ